MSQIDALGDRMKSYESETTSLKLEASTPVYARVDGRAFSTYTRGLEKPFDRALTESMIRTCEHLVRQTHATIGYVQSDEISLVWDVPEPPNGQIFFDGKIMKMCSVIASMAAACFTMLEGGRRSIIPSFDCRVFNVPSRTEATNALLWRWIDARKNGTRMIAHEAIGHKRLEGVSRTESLAMLAEMGISIADYPSENVYGTFVRTRPVERTLTPEELERIPERHRVFGPVIRSSVERTVLSDFISMDREAFVFG